VYVLQDRNGNVLSSKIRDCNIDSSAKADNFKDSIERAVYKASPLPVAPDDAVFDSEITFYFRAN
jgi:colicin import membrane protein